MSARSIGSLLGKPPGFRVLAEFLTEVEAGVIPSTEATVQLAQSLRLILDGTPAEKALSLTHGRGGRRKATVGERAKKDGAVVKFIWNHLERDPIPRGALARALRAAARRFHKDESTLRRKWRRHAPLYRAMKIFEQQNKIVECYLTPAELEEREAWPWPDTVALARERMRAPK